jgi:hypothetical protein
VFQYALKLRYPNGRTFDYVHASEGRIDVGHEFDVFGRRWRIAGTTPPSRSSRTFESDTEAFTCDPVSEPLSES